MLLRGAIADLGARLLMQVKLGLVWRSTAWLRGLRLSRSGCGQDSHCRPLLAPPPRHLPELRLFLPPPSSPPRFFSRIQNTVIANSPSRLLRRVHPSHARHGRRHCARPSDPHLQFPTDVLSTQSCNIIGARGQITAWAATLIAATCRPRAPPAAGARRGYPAVDCPRVP